MSLRDLGSSWARIRTWLYLTLELGVPLWYNIKFLFSDTKTFWIVPSIQWQPASYMNLGILSWSGASHLGFTCLFWAKWRILFLSKENCFLVLKQLSKKKKKTPNIFAYLSLNRSKAQWFVFFGCAGSLYVYHKRAKWAWETVKHRTAENQPQG